MKLRPLLPLLLAIAAPSPAAAAADWKTRRADAHSLWELGKGCELEFETGPSRAIDYEREVQRFLYAALQDQKQCPGLAQKVAAWVVARVGAPERADIDLELLRHAHRLVTAGKLVPADPAMAARYARMTWLFGTAAGATKAQEREWRKWLKTQQAVALLTARNDVRARRTVRSLELEADLRLRRDRPFYDARRAIELYEDARLYGDFTNRVRVARLWSDGVHVPPDFARAAAPLSYGATFASPHGADSRRELLGIARLAAAAARTPSQQAMALRIAFGAALDDDEAAVAARDRMLERIGKAPETGLAAGDAERIGRALDLKYAYALPYRWRDEPPNPQPIVLRGLIGPDGRLVLAVLARSSSSKLRDQAILGVWYMEGRTVDLSATAQGRFVWVELPPVDPMLTPEQARERWRQR